MSAAVISVIDRFVSGVPVCSAGEPGTGVSGSTLGRCEDGKDATGAADAEAEATVMLGVNMCGSLPAGPDVIVAAATGACVPGDDADGRCVGWGACCGPC